MKKFIFGGFAIVVIAVVAAFSVNLKSNEYGLSEVGLSNAEALANMLNGGWNKKLCFKNGLDSCCTDNENTGCLASSDCD